MRAFFTKPELFEAIQQAMRRTARAYPNDADALKRLSACMDVIHDASETAVPNIMNTQKDLETLQGFISVGQLQTLAAGTKGEEKSWFRETLATMAERVANMPKTYEQDGVEDPVAHLHYFVGSADWYIIEKDMGDKQVQAFGLADLGLGFPEMGYISLEDVIGHSAELDLHFDPTPLSVIKAGRA